MCFSFPTLVLSQQYKCPQSTCPTMRPQSNHEARMLTQDHEQLRSSWLGRRGQLTYKVNIKMLLHKKENSLRSLAIRQSPNYSPPQKISKSSLLPLFRPLACASCLWLELSNITSNKGALPVLFIMRSSVSFLLFPCHRIPVFSIMIIKK